MYSTTMCLNYHMMNLLMLALHNLRDSLLIHHAHLNLLLLKSRILFQI